jgi:hypothetical protein
MFARLWMYMVKLINKQKRDKIPNKLNREVLNDIGNIAFRWCLGLLRSYFCTSMESKFELVNNVELELSINRILNLA